MTSVGQEFKEFVLRGNVIDLAVALVIGAAFGAVVTSIVENLIMPLIAAIGGQPDFFEIGFTINDSLFSIGNVLNALISFLIIAAVIFFFVVKPTNMLIERSRREPTPDPTTRQCPACISEVPLAATRCAFCTSDLPPASVVESAQPA
ncbi:MAG: large conductance mechanosensitive channel protein MscL [Chloroflexia bacterium]|nr:large conductance mechanosensitive channel protein MscL [Chloroflexia bacterium]